MTFQIHRSMWCNVLQCPRSNLLLSFRLWYYLHRPIPKNSPEIDLSFREFLRSMSLHRNHEFIRFNVRCLFYQFFFNSYWSPIDRHFDHINYWRNTFITTYIYPYNVWSQILKHMDFVISVPSSFSCIWMSKWISFIDITPIWIGYCWRYYILHRMPNCQLSKFLRAFIVLNEH